MEGSRNFRHHIDDLFTYGVPVLLSLKNILHFKYHQLQPFYIICNYLICVIVNLILFQQLFYCVNYLMM